MMLQPIKSAASAANVQSNAANAVNTATTANRTSNNPPSATITDTLDYNDFLYLLVMQLRYQDPLDPLDNSAFVAQNAQFSTVEQLIAIKESLSSQRSALDAANATYATNMIGKLVAADVSTYNEAGEYEELLVSGIVKEISFIRETGEILITMDNDAQVYLSQIVSVREPE